MLTNLNPIVALWLIPVVLQVALPLAMLSVWSIVKIVNKIKIAKFQFEETGMVNCQAVLSAPAQ